ncbi:MULTISPECIES: NAD(P)H-quinone oxidoreductase [Ktedonobacter]|jgi:NADPH2:quinone reductase|uniref:NAD(P)H quinone oxidoreductase n=1 Tax=Ktedonobacter robiniae TaxID=2778365 RepID=A0ABQ3UMV1_9CHLR|nr:MULTISPECIES: NAD(P)H-quinone oxidoreductase [Ktedonobacter]GHO54023.1 NAD(P)H quinone oxidoreductase [Ktedonobacter robiniae]GHO68527.1 NAD(P)H quinone oxidoreductase [Ktedonobacter sp. SOSP1-52]
MKAVIITRAGGPEVLEVQEIATPEPIGDQVLVRVKAAGLNRADISQRMGHYPAPPGYPTIIPGLEFAGEVAAVGPMVRRWRPGQRVMGITGGGGQAEYLLIHEGLLVEIPENLDFIQAAAIPEVFITAHDALFTQGDLKMGERLLVHAAGSGVGTAAIQLASAMGCTVYGTSRTADKLERAKELGLDVGLSTENFAQEVKEMTHGEGVHLVLDFIGGPYMEGNLEALGLWGRLVFLATLGGADANVNLGKVMAKRLSIRGFTLRSRTLEEKLAATRHFAVQVVPLLARGRVRPIVEEVFPIERISEAHKVMQANRNFGKLVLALG